MALYNWALPHLQELLPLDEDELRQIITYTSSLIDTEAVDHLEGLLGESPPSLEFIAQFISQRTELQQPGSTTNAAQAAHPSASSPDKSREAAAGAMIATPVPAAASEVLSPPHIDEQQSNGCDISNLAQTSPESENVTEAAPLDDALPPSFAAATAPDSRDYVEHHTNDVIEAGKERAADEQEMYIMLRTLQHYYKIYNREIEPNHRAEDCDCPIHKYKQRKHERVPVLTRWSNAVKYPGEKNYGDIPDGGLLKNNPYSSGVVSPYGPGAGYQTNLNGRTSMRPLPNYHFQWIHQTIDLHSKLNEEAQKRVDAMEPKKSLWVDDELAVLMDELSAGDSTQSSRGTGHHQGKASRPHSNSKSLISKASSSGEASTSKLLSFKKAIGIKSAQTEDVTATLSPLELRNAILAEEKNRWPDEEWRTIVKAYQDKVGLTSRIAELRASRPLQYWHLLKAGYFEPIPAAWTDRDSNPLKFSIDAAGGWRGITPTWRGYEDLAEERLYWVLNHREGGASSGTEMKPDFVSAMNMARKRMLRAVEPPPLYFSPDDACHQQHTSEGYSRQVMPAPFRPRDRPEASTDDTMILLDISASMDTVTMRPNYEQYLITGYTRTTQPKNKDLARSILRRFVDAMANHDRRRDGYDLVTFSDQARHIGQINHETFDTAWDGIRFGGNTRVMSGWQAVKELHFLKHATAGWHHPVYGWLAGAGAPGTTTASIATTTNTTTMLRLLLLLDGEASDMDQFELDLLACDWAHVTIFLIGVEGCPHHHRHANELERISQANPHVSFVDAQGNTPERFVTHELLKRHLGYDISMQEFQTLEALPDYTH
ncbi:hypothetical protein BX600DRAFT_479497 [Xylariales sp. PMI_506]|nr:hypothetical protein BX600DRAFT_479497 [Xylariales sp. PMI_506]